MKITTFVLLILLASCSRQSQLTQETSGFSSKVKAPEACTFGLAQFPTTKRAIDASVMTKSPHAASFAGRPGEPEAVQIPNATIYLDFNGETVTNTIWNEWRGTINCGPAALSATEMEKIVQRVSEDFAAFNVVVTTNENLYAATDAAKRMRVIITDSWEWYGMAGGLAYDHSFTWGNNTPCFIFSSLLGYNEKYIAEAISHETGHTLGLKHQAHFDAGGTLLSEYNTGNGSGETGWAPIMGISYYQNITTWHKGPTLSGSGAVQDDVAIISSVLGTRPDANDRINKAVLVATEAEGLINTFDDVDYYLVDAGRPVTLAVKPNCLGNGEGANLQVRMTIMGRNNAELASVNSSNTLSASTQLEPGRYYVAIESYAPSGDRYGMLGRYKLSTQ